MRHIVIVGKTCRGQLRVRVRHAELKEGAPTTLDNGAVGAFDLTVSLWSMRVGDVMPDAEIPAGSV